ncbi:MAG: hypothetical protein LBQ38_13430 [Spirochaetaceae bacterium]|jgi:hypothetical protein|nr:hypothetical protein [Spirochaetaceae bacterium]
MKTGILFLSFMVLSMTCGSLFVQAQEGVDASDAGKVNFTLEFGASLFSVDSEGVVDSLTDIGFGDDAESTIGVGYEHELFGGTVSFAFAPETLRFAVGETADMLGTTPFTIDELYAWVKPFGANFKFTGGIFENTDGVADYTDDIDNFGMGVFFIGEGGEPFTEPMEYFDTSLTTGFLTDVIFGPVTVQLLLAPNYSKESGSGLANDFFSVFSLPPVDAGARFFRLGGRVIADIGVGTISAMFKTFQWPVEIVNVATIIEEGAPGAFGGSKVNYMSFGAYADITAVENLGLSLGYTGFTAANDGDDVDNILWSGVDLRATWTGIEGLSISTHNNFSFAAGAENDWTGELLDGDSFLTLYNVIGATKELTEKFSINAEIGNVLSKTDSISFGEIEFDNFWVGAKFIAAVTENAEFNAGLRVDLTKNGDDTVTVFSIPVGISLSF